MIAPSETIGPQTTLQRVLEVFPGAQRALFRRYHIGGCSSCGFQPGETLEELCRRNNQLLVAEVIAHIQSSHEQDLQMLVAPLELSQWQARGEPLRLLDVRTREEWEAARIDGSMLLSQDLLQDMLAKWPRHALIVICDHLGKQGLDAAAYFLGHGFENVRALRGGIDAWSQEVDSKIPRYRVE